jgi:hypothetical protein
VIEATLIRNGAVDDDYTKTLFKIDPIIRWLQTSKAKPLVNLIDIDMFGGQAHHLSQPHSQLSQPPMAPSQHYSQFQNNNNNNNNNNGNNKSCKRLPLLPISLGIRESPCLLSSALDHSDLPHCKDVALVRALSFLVI